MIFSERAIVQSDASRPSVTNLLESDGRMTWVGFEKLEVLIGKLTNRNGQLPVVEPKLRRGEVVQSGVQRPAS